MITDFHNSKKQAIVIWGENLKKIRKALLLRRAKIYL